MYENKNIYGIELTRDTDAEHANRAMLSAMRGDPDLFVIVPTAATLGLAIDLARRAVENGSDVLLSSGRALAPRGAA